MESIDTTGYDRERVTIIGGGLAGCEAALQLAERGMNVTLHEMRPFTGTAVHETGDLAELVCSNSFKSTDIDSAAGLLKAELSMLGSILLETAFSCRVPAGGALAVDRQAFSQAVTQAIEDDPRIELVRDEVTSIAPFIDSGQQVVIAAGPLASDRLAQDIVSTIGGDRLAFYDAAAPIVEADSLDRERLFAQSRNGRGGGADYLNAPLSREEYDAFVTELIGAQRVIEREFEQRELFSACQPIEQVARTGHDAIRFGALKPVGLIDPHDGRRPFAAVQLRSENAASSAYNLVGFQTNLRFAEQDRVFRMIPGLESAVFSRHGVMHRNTFLDSPHTLDATFAMPQSKNVRFAGQICGTEGYMEAIASGLLAALSVYSDLSGLPAPILPKTCACGALFDYATDKDVVDYQPMHVNFGIMPPLAAVPKKKAERYAAYSQRAREELARFIADNPSLRFHRYTGPDMQQVSDSDGRRG